MISSTKARMHMLMFVANEDSVCQKKKKKDERRKCCFGVHGRNSYV